MKLLSDFLRQLARLFRLGAQPERRDQLEALAQQIEPQTTLELLKLVDSQKLILKDISAHVESRNQRGTVALFTGLDSGGQSHAAEAIALDLRRRLYRVDLSRVNNKYIGETEKNLDRLFNAAESTGAILFFDEADALFGKRSDVKDAHDRYANIEISYLLQRLESFKGVAILATNHKQNIPDGFLRRVRFNVEFPPPD